MKKNSVTINGTSYNADFAKELGKEEWCRETGLPADAFDAMMNQLEEAKKEEAEAAKEKEKEDKLQAEAKKKLAGRSAKTAQPTGAVKPS